jgi:peptidyl-prolyl cis-trans isomerase C
LIKHWYLIASLAVFALGAWMWKLKGSRIPTTSGSVAEKVDVSKFGSVIVEVGKDKILRTDIDWEYQLLTNGINDNTNLTPIPNLGSKIHQELGPLRRSILESMIERKLLYAMVKKDENFDSTDAARYTGCLEDWQKATRALPADISASGGSDRLKTRLCERSLIEQYLTERVYKTLTVSEAEITEYFKGHPEEFRRPEQVRIRQIVVADENTAKRVSNTTTAANFTEMARTYSISPEGKNGGHLGPFAKHGMPAFFEAAFTMKKNQISTVLKSNYGYHIMILDEKIPEHGMSFDEARPVIHEKLLATKREAAYQEWVERALIAISVKAPSALW